MNTKLLEKILLITQIVINSIFAFIIFVLNPLYGIIDKFALSEYAFTGVFDNLGFWVLFLVLINVVLKISRIIINDIIIDRKREIMSASYLYQDEEFLKRLNISQNKVMTFSVLIFVAILISTLIFANPISMSNEAKNRIEQSSNSK